MRETMDKFSLFPFSIGCISHSSVDVIQTHPQTDSNPPPPPPPPPSREGEELEEEKPKTAIGLAHISKPRIGERLQKLVKSIKSFPSHVFQVYKDEEEEDDDYEVEMEIGLPTDVQHVGHIGWDGSNNNNNNNNINNTVSTMKNWDKAPAEFMYSPSL